MHLEEEQVQRLLHDELAPAELDRARDHVAHCTDCRELLETAKRDGDEVSALLRHLDHPVPFANASAIIARTRRRNRSWVNKVAAALLVVGLGGVAWAAPGSPLPAVLKNVISRFVGTPNAPARPDVQTAPSVAGIAVAPGRSLIVAFTAAQVNGAARVSLTDSGDVVVRAPAGVASFTTNADRLVIENTGSTATFEIEIPRTAAHVEIRVNGNRVFVKNGRRITAPNAVERGGLYIVPIVK